VADPLKTNFYVLCPGQGAQVVGMGKELYAASAEARAVFDQANELAGYDLSSICFNGPDTRLNETDVSQPALYVVGVASFRAAVAAGVFDSAAVTAYGGLSLGEYTALHLAGAFSFEEGLRLVSLRGKWMQEAAVANPSGMVAIIGGDETAVRKLCDAAAGDQFLVPANFNCPGQIVVSGGKEACQRIVAQASKAGVGAKALAVAGAFHSPYMQSAADRMREALAASQIQPPRTPVYSNVTAQVHTDVDSIKRLLVDQITHPVRWEQTMTALVAGGEARYIELAPGRTLAGLAKRINRRLVVEENAGIKPATGA
jgi:[acyl-carrier-protein] S-malonyltransferase